MACDAVERWKAIILISLSLVLVSPKCLDTSYFRFTIMLFPEVWSREIKGHISNGSLTHLWDCMLKIMAQWRYNHKHSTVTLRRKDPGKIPKPPNAMLGSIAMRPQWTINSGLKRLQIFPSKLQLNETMRRLQITVSLLLWWLTFIFSLTGSRIT